MNKVSLETLVSLAKRRGFIYQGSDIYGGLSGTWDYGPLGTVLKRNLANLWWQTFVQERDDIYPLDSAILMNQKVWQASGHVEGFNDPLVECSNCHMRFREDHVKDSCPNCGKKNTFAKARSFNMMFKTSVGPVAAESAAAYLRPETAQGIFTNFKNILDSFSPNLPFGVAQIGKAFRNEISPRDFTFRAREFEQAEIEYFIDPKDWQEQFDKWAREVYKFLAAVGLNRDKIHEHEISPAERAHYSKRTIDFEFDFPFGKSELLGLAYRTDFDLQSHQKASGKNLEYIPKDGSKPFIPHVIEPSFGLDRLLLAILANAYTEDEVGGEKRVFLKLSTNLAPIKIAVFPLLKNKPELVKQAREVYQLLKMAFGALMFDDNGNIGKRYRRQDEIGTPYTVTIDFDTLKDSTVTVRDRNTTKQERTKIKSLIDHFKTLIQ